MDVGLVIYGNLDTLSGGYLYDRKLVAYLESQGDNIEVISLPWRDYARHIGDNLSRELVKRLSNLSVDVLLQDELNHPSLFWINQRIRRRVSYPLVSIVHHLRCSENRLRWRNFLYWFVERRYLNSVDAFIFNSEVTRQSVSHIGVNLNSHPSLIAHPAGDQLNPEITEEAIISRARESGPLRLLFLGNVIPRKGLHTLLEAMCQLPIELCRLDVVGSMGVDKSYAGAIRRMIKKFELGDMVSLCGKLNEHDLIDKLRSSQLLVVPSSYEGFGIAYLEGMGFGLPAIASSSGGPREIITHGQDGYLLPTENPITLAETLARLANDRHRLADMSIAARKRYIQGPTWEQTGERIRSFLVSLIGR